MKNVKLVLIAALSFNLYACSESGFTNPVVPAPAVQTLPAPVYPNGYPNGVNPNGLPALGQQTGVAGMNQTGLTTLCAQNPNLNPYASSFRFNASFSFYVGAYQTGNVMPWYNTGYANPCVLVPTIAAPVNTSPCSVNQVSPCSPCRTCSKCSACTPPTKNYVAIYKAKVKQSRNPCNSCSTQTTSTTTTEVGENVFPNSPDAETTTTSSSSSTTSKPVNKVAFSILKKDARALYERLARQPIDQANSAETFRIGNDYKCWVSNDGSDDSDYTCDFILNFAKGTIGLSKSDREALENGDAGKTAAPEISNQAFQGENIIIGAAGLPQNQGIIRLGSSFASYIYTHLPIANNNASAPRSGNNIYCTQQECRIQVQLDTGSGVAVTVIN